MTPSISLVTAFGAGVLSFVSPCVLPIVPGYLSFISGSNVSQLRGAEAPRDQLRRVAITSLCFVLGFSTVFVALGAAATAVGYHLQQYKRPLAVVGGFVIVVLGLHTAGVFRIPWLLYEMRAEVKTKPLGLLGAYVVGLAFAFGWTPCIGPILSAILLVAAQQESVNQGIVLLSVYSLGLAIPFLLTALAINQFFVAFKKIRRHYHTIEIVSGLLMIVIGVLIFTNRFTIIAQWLTPYLPVL